MPSVRFFAESNEAAIVFSKFCASWTLAWSFRRRSSSNSLSRCACFSRNFSISSAIICSLEPGAGAFGVNDARAAAGTGFVVSIEVTKVRSLDSFSSSAGVRWTPPGGDE